MDARQVEATAARLAGMRETTLGRLGLAVAAGLAAVAAGVGQHAAVAASLGLGALALAVLSIAELLARRDLIAALAFDRSAYFLPDVRRYGEKVASTRSRQMLARALTGVVSQPPAGSVLFERERVDRCRSELADLAAELAACERMDPVAAVTCRRLVEEPSESPLYAATMTAQDLAAAIIRIRAGIESRPDRPPVRRAA